MRAVDSVNKWTYYVVFVIFFQVLESYGHNIQLSDYNASEIQMQTITIGDYSSSDKITVAFPGSGTDFDQPDQASLDTWSVVWYVASFGGLILFFLIVSCSEWCCRRNARRNCQRSNNAQSATPQAVDTPPPSYDHFAPPSYEELWVGSSSRGPRGEKSEFDIYVVPVHAFGTLMEGARREDAPPSYQSANGGFAQLSELPRVHSTRSEVSRIT